MPLIAVVGCGAAWASFTSGLLAAVAVGCLLVASCVCVVRWGVWVIAPYVAGFIVLAFMADAWDDLPSDVQGYDNMAPTASVMFVLPVEVVVMLAVWAVAGLVRRARTRPEA